VTLRNGKINLLLLDPSMRAIVLINPSSTVALILLVIGLQTGSLGYEQVSEVRLSATTSRDDSGLFSAKESRIGNSMEAGSINETRDTRTAPHLMELARDAKTNPADDKRGGSLRATHLPRFKSITGQITVCHMYILNETKKEITHRTSLLSCHQSLG